MTQRKNEYGQVTGALIATICLTTGFVLVSVLAIWLYVLYADQKSNVDSKIEEAAAIARKEQLDEDEAKFAEREKEPRREFVGPDDYGRVTFMYPKTWSAYVAQDAANRGDYLAYLNPILVPPTDSKAQQFALRVSIHSQSYENVLKKYSNLVEKGDLKSSKVTANGQTGDRLDGNFSKNIRGSAVLFKVRDKTLVIQTDLSSSEFKAEFDKIIKTITFNT